MDIRFLCRLQGHGLNLCLRPGPLPSRRPSTPLQVPNFVEALRKFKKNAK